MRLISDPLRWNSTLAALPHPHLLQTWEWGEFKSRYGWHPRRFLWENAAAQVLTRSVRGLKVMYVPKGPLLDWQDAALRAQIFNDLQQLARRERAIFIKLDPDVILSSDASPQAADSTANFGVTSDLRQGGWRPSPEQIQFRNTVVMDLRPTEAELLARMKQKTRYNVRLAEKKGVRVRLGSAVDLDPLYRMYVETSLRDGFVIRSAEYYRDAWGSFIEAGLAQPLLAEVEGEVVSAIILFKFAQTAWYIYGMSRDAHRDKMPNHLLQWEAMRWAKTHGCDTYDFWGAPDELNENDSMWGVWKFKEGFGGQFVRHIGAWDYAPFPILYWGYTQVMPRVLDIMRRRGQAQTRQMME